MKDDLALKLFKYKALFLPNGSLLPQEYIKAFDKNSGLPVLPEVRVLADCYLKVLNNHLCLVVDADSDQHNSAVLSVSNISHADITFGTKEKNSILVYFRDAISALYEKTRED